MTCKGGRVPLAQFPDSGMAAWKGPPFFAFFRPDKRPGFSEKVYKCMTMCYNSL